MDSAGDFVVAWENYNAGGYGVGYAVYAQQYNASGATYGGEFLVNTYALGLFSSPTSVAMDSAGDFVVSWQSEDSSGYGIYAQQYNASGTAHGSEFQVNTSTAGNQDEPSVAMDSEGDFVVTWSGYNPNVDGKGDSGYDIYAQQYNSSGVAQGSNFQVNTLTAGNQYSPAAAMDSAGDFVVTWQGYNQAGNSKSYEIYAQQYSRSGVAQGSQFEVNSDLAVNEITPAVALDAQGDFVIAWASGKGNSGAGMYEDGSDYGVFAARYNPPVVTTTASALNYTAGSVRRGGRSGRHSQRCREQHHHRRHGQHLVPVRHRRGRA